MKLAFALFISQAISVWSYSLKEKNVNDRLEKSQVMKKDDSVYQLIMKRIGGNVSRIINGHPVGEYDLPHQAYYSSGKYFCSGTIIGRRHVLTALHCMHEEIPIGEHYVLLGVHDIDFYQSNNRFQVQKLIKYSSDMDIGILLLERDIIYSWRIKPACIPGKYAETYAGKYVVVSGWGRTVAYLPGQKDSVEKGLPNVLLKTEVQVQPSYSSLCWESGAYTPDKMCAYRQGHDTCKGDSGGPMTVIENGKLVVIGVTSDGKGCAASGHAGVYVRVSYFHDWIKQQVPHVCVSAEQTILIESLKGAAEYIGNVLGYFDKTQETLNGRPVYKQRGDGWFLYHDAKYGNWKVSTILGNPTGFLYVTSEDSVPPSSGWQYWGGGRDRTDPTLSLTTSPPDPSSRCTTIQVAATGPAASAQSEMMGKYQWEGEWLNGHKLFRGGRDGDQYLRVPTGKTNWMISSSKDGTTSGIFSGRATTCPCQQEAGPSIRLGLDWWSYWSGHKWQMDSSIWVTCEESS